MEVAKIIENREINKIYGLIGNINLTTNNKNIGIITSGKFKGSVKEYLNSPKTLSSLKMVLLNESVLSKTANECSICELKKISLAKALIENKKYLVFNFFEKELNYKEMNYFKRLWNRLINDYQKTIIIFTNDLTNFLDILYEIIIVDKYQVINTILKKQYFSILKDTNESPIQEIINIIKAKGKNIEDYIEVNDLLKAIYRLKEQEKWNI